MAAIFCPAWGGNVARGGMEAVFAKLRQRSGDKLAFGLFAFRRHGWGIHRATQFLINRLIKIMTDNCSCPVWWFILFFPATGIIYAVCHKNCYTPPLHDIVVFVIPLVSISLKTTPVTVGAVRSSYVF
ncbi:Uncharacterised protein [Citrobacter koseri]|uniref:Uncharacterized protein n=1 Tax=Citrobacter koseri TaxID=545 RepID=A0A3S5DPA1_CITKO|nr:Uncharacterised protein [Citrobacter koseri]